MRMGAGIFVSALFLWLLVSLLITGGSEANAGPQTWTSSRQCMSCHEEVFAEWQDSWHARSWTDPDVRAPSQSNNFQNKDCIDCHAPRPVFETGVGNRVLPRSSRRSEGVDCIACHLLPNGRMAGTIDNPRAACKPQATVELQREDYCGVCHNQHKTVDQWRDTAWAERGEGCLHCHMPFRDGDPNRGRHHGMPGGHDLELVASAVTLTAQRDVNGVGVRVSNVAAAHSYPTDERSRASDLWWRPLAESGEELPWRHLHRIRDPYRWEVDVPSTLLMPAEERELRIDGPDAGGPLEVLLVYKLTPFYRDPATGAPHTLGEVTDPLSDSQEVHRVVVEAGGEPK